MEPTKLIRIKVLLHKGGIKFTETEWDCDPKKVVYILTRYDEDFKGKICQKRINKNDIFKIDSTFILNHNHIDYRMFSLPEDVEKNKAMLLEKVKNVALEFQASINAMVSHLNIE